MAPPYTQTNAMRIYDRMVANWVNSLPVDYGNLSGKLQTARGMLWVYASPTKALASMSNVLLRKGWVDVGDTGADGMEADDWITCPLPFASIQRQDPEYDPARAQVPFRFRKFLRSGDVYKSVRYPIPYDLNYNVEYWMRRKFTDAYIREWIMSQVSPLGAATNEFFMTAQFGTLWGNKLIPIQNISVVDNSDLEPDDTGDRTLRMSLTFTLKAWIFPPVETTETKIVLRIITDIGPMSRLDSNDFESLYDTIITDPDDTVEELLERDAILFETDTGVTQSGNTFTIPAGEYIQTVDIPVYRDELVFVEADLVLDPALSDGIDVEVRDFNQLPIQEFQIMRGVTEDTPAFWIVPDSGVGSVRIRFSPSGAVDLTVNDVVVKTVTRDLPDQTNLLSAGDMESGVPGDWTPQIGSTTLVPSSIAFDTGTFHSGTQSLRVGTTGVKQGMERVIPVSPFKLFLVELYLYGSGGPVELGLLDDADGSHVMESTFIVYPQSQWDRYALAIRSRSSGQISLRVRQQGSTAATFYVDDTSVYEIVVRGDERDLSNVYV